MPFGVRNRSARPEIEVDGATFVDHSWTVVPDVTDAQAIHPDLHVLQVNGPDDVRLSMYPVIVDKELAKTMRAAARAEKPADELDRLRVELPRWKENAETSQREVAALKGEIATLRKTMKELVPKDAAAPGGHPGQQAAGAPKKHSAGKGKAGEEPVTTEIGGEGAGDSETGSDVADGGAETGAGPYGDAAGAE